MCSLFTQQVSVECILWAQAPRKSPNFCLDPYIRKNMVYMCVRGALLIPCKVCEHCQVVP